MTRHQGPNRIFFFTILLAIQLCPHSSENPIIHQAKFNPHNLNYISKILVPLFYNSFNKASDDRDFCLLDHSGVRGVLPQFPDDPRGGSMTHHAPLSFSALLPVEVAFRRGLSIVSPLRTIKLKTRTNACVIMNPDLWNSKNATSRPAGRVLVSQWLCIQGESFS